MNEWRVVEADSTVLVALCASAEEARALARVADGALIVEPPADDEGEAA